ncbi:Germacrene A oxidase [Dichanthelium oligosanthes]|uniref:Germacrene A oxidase n=1 Tax=Dichanthelium oligosanthes TaxID=888268 RepID=A0A1E5UMD3_9POAL|nr:Germacrene A oxidase [Dichanthelium oligosanthes]
MHSLLGALQHHAMRRLARRYGPVMLLRLSYVRTVVVSSPEAAREVMKTHDTIFANRPVYVTMDIFTFGGQSISFAPYGSRHWKELRRLCATDLLSPKRILSFRPIREEEMAGMVRSVAASPTAPLVNVSDREMEKVLNLLAGFNLVDMFPTSRLARVLGGRSLRAARQVHARIHSIMVSMIRDHATAVESRVAVAGRGNNGAADNEDLLDTLLRLQRDGVLDTTLSTEIISATLFELFSTGSETTATTITWAMSELMRNPRAMERAQSDIRKLHGKAEVKEEDIEGKLHYLQTVIKEPLRLHALKDRGELNRSLKNLFR